TLDIVAYIPGQPFFGVHVKNLLAYAAMKGGLYGEEKAIRGEVVKELDKMWSAAAQKSSLRDADTLLLSRALNSYALAALRLRAYGDVRTLCDTWMPRFETLLFGKGAAAAPASASSTTQSPAVPAAPAPSRLSSPSSSAGGGFSTGALMA